MPLMRLGPLVFGIPTFSYESLNRQVSARVESVPVIGALPPTHLLGPNGDTLDLTSTFYPRHLNAGGLAQLRVAQELVRSQVPLMMVSIGGMIFGRWVLVSVGEDQKTIGVGGTPQQVDVDMSLQQYVGGGSGFGIF